MENKPSCDNIIQIFNSILEYQMHSESFVFLTSKELKLLCTSISHNICSHNALVSEACPRVPGLFRMCMYDEYIYVYVHLKYIARRP